MGLSENWERPKSGRFKQKPKTSDQASNFVGTLVLYNMKFGVWFHLPLRPGLRHKIKGARQGELLTCGG